MEYYYIKIIEMGRKSKLQKTLTSEPSRSLTWYSKKPHAQKIIKITDKLIESALKSHGKRRQVYVEELRRAIANLAVISLKYENEKKYYERLENILEKKDTSP